MSDPARCPQPGKARVHLRFEHSGFSYDASPGEAILDITDKHPEADVPYSCMSATCGTCRVRVLEGAHLLSPPEADELEVLEMYGDNPNEVRLCCQAKVQLGKGTARLSVVD